MQALKRFALAAAIAAPLAILGLDSTADERATVRFQHSGRMPAELATTAVTQADFFTEAPTGFDNRTNGFMQQGPAFDDLDDGTVVPNRSFNDNRFIFEEVEGIADGLGPTYNAQSCAECHQNVVTGGASQIAEHRTGRLDVSGGFFESLGGSLIHSRATNAAIVERVAFEDDVRTFRISTNTLGNGFIECVANETLLAIRDAQPAEIRGTAVMVPVLEGGNAMRVGRFGWKNQHASLVSFAADEYLNEIGITSPLLPAENTSNGNSVAAYDTVSDPEDDGSDVETFARFIRATTAPPRDEYLAATAEARAGESLFNQIGCAHCHTPTITTAPAGTLMNGGRFIVPEALGDKVIHPFSDFLLHNVGTGDGIVQNGGPSTRNKLRTPPLWGLRTRNRLMHDGQSLSLNSAILRHGGEASHVTSNYQRLRDEQKRQLITFLKSL